MSLTSATALVEGAAWALSGAPMFGRRLVDRVVSGDSDSRAVAGMYLVRNPDKAVPLIAAELDSGTESEELVTVLASIANPEAEAALARLAGQAERSTASSAAAALEDLEQIKRRT